jgi:hypothetical protein
VRKQTITWTALPHGLTGRGADTRLKLSVFVSPRLQTDEGSTLALFPDFLKWPATALAFSVQLGSAPPVTAQRVGPPPRLDLWQLIFGAASPLKPFVFKDYSTRALRSYPIRYLATFFEQQYVKYATTSPTEHPLVSELALSGSFGQLGFYPRGAGDGPSEADLVKALETVLSEKHTIPPTASPSVAKSALQLKRFHQQRNNKRMSEPAQPEFDCHEVFSALGQFPAILRLLGLIHDLELPLPAAAPPASQISVLPSWAPLLPQSPPLAATLNVSPETRYLLDPGNSVFMAAPRQSEPDIADGLLAVNDGSYDAVQFDVDGATIKSLNFAGSLLRALSPEHKSDDTAERQPIPSLRSAGIALTRLGRATKQHQRFAIALARNGTLAQNQKTVLDAEDVTRGWRVDVQDTADQVWRSLHRRKGTYKFLAPDTDLVLPAIEDEGWTTTSMTSASDPQSPNDLYLSESIARWDGWSLSVRRPGGAIGAKGEQSTPTAAGQPPFNFEAGFEQVVGSLPRLRYGRQYRLRVRAVDLSGGDVGSKPPDPGNLALTVGPIRYGRGEPVPPPVVALRRALETPGETLERLVIRSHSWDQPGQLTVPTERHLVPPKGSYAEAEAAGRLDTDLASGSPKLDPAKYQLVAEWEGGTLGGDLAQNPVLDMDNLTFPHPINPNTPARPLPYLPDPFSGGLTLRGLPGQPLFWQDWGQAKGATWPNLRSSRIELFETAATTFFPPPDDARLLRIGLAKGDVLRLRYSSSLEPGRLTDMLLWHWIEKAGLATGTLWKHAQEGSHWMFTPYRQLTLVHAVKQPLLAPNLQGLAAGKARLGHTFATLNRLPIAMPISGKSTEKLEVFAHWTEPVDPLDLPGPTTIACQARAFEIGRIDRAATSVEIRDRRHEFGDTRCRLNVQYSATATTCFAEHFVEQKTVKLTDSVPASIESAGIAPNSEVVKVRGVAYRRAEDGVHGDYVMDYQAGTIRRGVRSAIPSGVGVQVSYVPGSITRETPAPVALTVPSSARPDAPKVLYVLPTFGWAAPAPRGGQVTRKRLGNSLRVYLDRPWYSSGAGELLGVVLWPGPTGVTLGVPQVPRALAARVTQWGQDPLWQSAPTDPRPTLAAFKGTKATPTGLSLDELNVIDEHGAITDTGPLVDVAAYEPGYDPERRLWYCDIEVDAGDAYLPFVRLALARYQPTSIAHAHLSRVVLTEFTQLAPDRTATFTVDPADSTRVRVSLSGLGYTASRVGLGPAEVEVTVERQSRDPDVTDPELSWQPVPGQPTRLPPIEVNGTTIVWTGDVTLPAPRGTTPFRLVLSEYERYPGDSPGAAPARRLVYADKLEL